MSNSENNKRIAKNTIYLYMRMLLVMLVSLYTVRVILETLGAEDYGLYNVVGGIIVMMSFVTSTLSSASLRFFAFELGRNNQERLNRYFNMTLLCYVVFAIFVLVVGETLGLWFFNTQLNIPPDRMSAAMWVYQCSIVSFVAGLLALPYNALIVAREEMNVYAIVGIVEVVLKLLVAYFLFLFAVDKLKLYAVLMASVAILTTTIYVVYTKQKFRETELNATVDRSIIKEVVGFSSWQLFGAISSVLRSQGINILLNIFFNPVVNAARAIAYQVNGAVMSFETNFYKAVNPQITKLYSSGQRAEMLTLVFSSSKLCYFLFMIFGIPLILEIPFVLGLWLKTVPEYTELFTRLILILSLLDAIGFPFQAAISATGRISIYQIVTGGLLLLSLPVSYVFLKMGYPPEITMVISICIAALAQISRMIFMKVLLGMSIRRYLYQVILPIILVTIISFGLSYIFYQLFEEGFLRVVSVSLLSAIISASLIYTIGITKAERQKINSIVRTRILNKK